MNNENLLMNAIDVKKMTEDVKNNTYNEQIQKIADLIKNEALKGNSSISYNEHLPIYVINLLKSKGYTVETLTQYNEAFTFIKW
jgi:hypothetical protein